MALKGLKTEWPALVLLGLLASGGSGFWTSILGYVNGLKDTQKTIAVNTKLRTAANMVAIAAGNNILVAIPAAKASQKGGQPANPVPVGQEDAAAAKLKEVIIIASYNL